MNNQEAIKRIRENIALISDLDCTEYELAISALEKQIPKIPYTYGDGDADGYPVIDMYECPNCGETYEIECDHYDYCPKCGQRMDRSDEVFK